MVPAIRNNNSLIPTAGPVNRIGSLFDTFFNEAVPAWSGAPLSLWEDENAVHVEMDAPGLTDKDVELSVHQGVLVIKGERKSERKERGYDTRSYGRFEQHITLPSPVDADRVEAKLANGVLSVTFPKSESAKPRRIALKSE